MSRARQAARQKLSPGQAIQQALGFHQQGRLEEAERLYNDVLKVERNQFDALHLLGTLRYQQGRYSDAYELIAAALQANAASVAALSNYGLVLNKLDRHDEALAAYDKALALSPDNFSLHYNRGLVLHACGRDDEAIKSYDRTLAIRPNDLDVVIDRANALRALGRHDEALASYDRALELVPGHVNGLYNRATLLQQLGRFDEALKSCKVLLVLQPDHVEALNASGKSLVALGQVEEALARYDRALAVDPHHINALVNRCSALVALARMDEALDACDRALAIAPDHAVLLYLRGGALQSLDRHGEAVASYDRALAIEPNYADALCDRGFALMGTRAYDDALTNLEQALTLNPRHVDALNNRGVVLQRLGRPQAALANFDRALLYAPQQGDKRARTLSNRASALTDLGRHQDALKSCQQALAIAPDDAEANFNDAFIRLCLGDFREGWKKYEWRWRTRQLAPHRRGFSQPLWRGEEPLHGRTILLHAEQGLGDTIQFGRYASLLSQRGAKVVLEVQPSLKALMANVEGASVVVARGEELPPFDVHCPLLSLPLAFNTEPDTIPGGAYLRAPPDRISRWERRLADVEGPKIGLVWTGRPTHHNDRNRSIPLARLSGLVSRDDIGVVSLQRELHDDDAEALASNSRIVHLGNDFEDFADTAAVVSLLDLVISVDTSVAHLAGALGKPVWILLPFGPDFRWMLNRPDSPWYPTARLFRQPRPGDWDSVLEAVRAELDSFAPT